jgi:hypothetical protein
MMRKCAITVAILFVLWWIPKNRFDVINESGQTIHALTVRVSERTIKFGDVYSGESKSWFFYTPRGETYFEVRGQLEDGTQINDDVGYVVWEDYFLDRVILILPEGKVESHRD